MDAPIPPAAAAAYGPETLEGQFANVKVARDRAKQRLGERERLAVIVVGGAFLPAAALLRLMPSDRAQPFWVTAAVVVLYLLVSRLDYEVGPGSVVPTQLVFVPMLFVFPLGQVPALVALALTGGAVVDVILGRIHAERVALRLVDSWFAVGPVLVLSLAGEAPPSVNDLPLYAVALTAQFTFEFSAFAARNAIAFGVDLREELQIMRETAPIDVGLASVGLAIAFPAAVDPIAFLLAVPPIVLLRILSLERRAHVDSALELSGAYRGTAFLLGDVIEADDMYTGTHSRDVVELSVAVARDLDLSAKQLTAVELVALLHDVGKISVPNEIINKQGPLDDEEWALMRQHTIAGEAMLLRVGGALAAVGTLVRSCHERWDGGGYPDGLAGEEIPVEARIVAVCDAYSAMTTDRSYRAALSKSDALAELLTNAGSQFDPVVVTALVSVVETGFVGAALEPSAGRVAPQLEASSDGRLVPSGL